MIKTYSQALDYIYSFIDFSLTRNLRYSPEKFNLNRMVQFLELLNNPHQKYKVIHVAGTKGKGSTAAMLANILKKNKYRTGLYSSPHIIDFSERIRIGNELISHESIVNYINLLEPTIQKVPELTTFEIITGMAFMYFAEKSVDFAVIEVGMGGRFDATNVVYPEVSVITSISHDHIKILGKSLNNIAFEKAGIIKKGIPVVVLKQKPSALKSIKEIAAEKGSKLIYTPDIYNYESVSYSLEDQKFKLIKNRSEILEINLSLLGDHQIENAINAYACIEEVKNLGTAISKSSVLEGFKDVYWPGRFEIINKKPLVIIDGAHNTDSFRKLRDTIIKYLPGKQIILIFGASEDKEVISMLKIIKPLIRLLIITQSHHPRAMDIRKIKDISEKLGIPYCVQNEVAGAIGEAFNRLDESTSIIAAGSLFIAGAVREVLKDK